MAGDKLPDCTKVIFAYGSQQEVDSRCVDCQSFVNAGFVLCFQFVAESPGCVDFVNNDFLFEQGRGMVAIA